MSEENNDAIQLSKRGYMLMPLAGPDEQKRIIVSELLWNLSIGGQKIQQSQFKSAYAMVAERPKPTNLDEMLRG